MILLKLAHAGEVAAAQRHAAAENAAVAGLLVLHRRLGVGREDRLDLAGRRVRLTDPADQAVVGNHRRVHLDADRGADVERKGIKVIIDVAPNDVGRRDLIGRIGLFQLIILPELLVFCFYIIIIRQLFLQLGIFAAQLLHLGGKLLRRRGVHGGGRRRRELKQPLGRQVDAACHRRILRLRHDTQYRKDKERDDQHVAAAVRSSFHGLSFCCVCICWRSPCPNACRRRPPRSRADVLRYAPACRSAASPACRYL